MPRASNDGNITRDIPSTMLSSKDPSSSMFPSLPAPMNEDTVHETTMATYVALTTQSRACGRVSRYTNAQIPTTQATMAASSERSASASASPTGIAGVLCIVVGANQPTRRATQSQKVRPNGCTDMVFPAIENCVSSAARIWQNRMAATTAPDPFSIIFLDRLLSVAVIPTITTAGTSRLACSVSPQELSAMNMGNPTAAPEDIRYRMALSSLSE